MVRSTLISPASVVLVAVVLLCGCQPPDERPPPGATESDTSAASRERHAVRTEDDVRRLVQEPLLIGPANWTGYYHTVEHAGEHVLDGPFHVEAEQTVPEFPGTPIRSTYDGQYDKGMPYGTFAAEVDAPEAHTSYVLRFADDGTCSEGIIRQQGEGAMIERVVRSPSPCAFYVLRDSLYAP